MLSGLSESLVARRAEWGQEKAYIQDELMHVALPMQGTGEQGQQPGFSLKAEGGRCVSHRDHALGAPYLLQDLWLPLIGHSNSEHKPILWEDMAKEVMSEHLEVLCCLYPGPQHTTHRDISLHTLTSLEPFLCDFPPCTSLTLRTSVCVAVARHCSRCCCVNSSARRSWKAARTRCTASAL